MSDAANVLEVVMSVSQPNELVELRFQVPIDSLEATLQAIAPFTLSVPDPVSSQPASNAKYVGVTQKELCMLLKGRKPAGR